MLTGTLVTVAGFIPIGLNSSAAGEFTFTLFVVIAVSLIVSWIVAVLFTPLLGVTLLPNDAEIAWRARRAFRDAVFPCAARCDALAMGHDRPHASSPSRPSVYGMRFVEQQFFPSSDRPELIVDWNLPQNASIEETNAEMARFEREMLAKSGDIDHWSTYVGEGAPRFVLSFDVQPADPTFGQIVIVSKGLDVRDRLRGELQAYLTKTFPGTDAYVKLLDIGPPVGRPVQYRVSGPRLQTVRDLAQKVAGLMAGNANLGEPIFDWNEPARVIKIDVLQDKARQLGVSSVDIASALNNVVSGATVTQLRDDIYLIDVIARAKAERARLDRNLADLQLPATNGQSVPLAAVAKFGYGLEQPRFGAAPAAHDHGAGRRARRDPARDRGPATRARDGGVPRRACPPAIRS